MSTEGDLLAYKIPFAADRAWFSQPITLQGVAYTLEFQYNARAQRWFMDILDASEQPILLGIPLEIRRDLNGQYGAYVFPKGLFFCRDNSGSDNPPTLNSFNVDHQLLFVDLT